jgi:hypothetical protein
MDKGRETGRKGLGERRKRWGGGQGVVFSFLPPLSSFFPPEKINLAMNKK